MAGVAFISGKRYVNGKEDSLFAIGTVQADGYIYFNDEDSFRCTTTGEYIQIYNVKRQRWVETNSVYGIASINFDVSGIIDAVGGLVGGGGAVSPNADVEKMVQWAIDIANNPAHGYDQTNRTGPDYDCSSFVSAAARIGGFDIPITDVSGLIRELPKHGWVYDKTIGNSASQLQRGDVLIREGYHTEIYIGNNQNVGAHSNEFGGISGGQPGDQSGNEISVTGFYSAPWTGVLRYKG